MSTKGRKQPKKTIFPIVCCRKVHGYNVPDKEIFKEPIPLEIANIENLTEEETQEPGKKPCIFLANPDFYVYVITPPLWNEYWETRSPMRILLSSINEIPAKKGDIIFIYINHPSRSGLIGYCLSSVSCEDGTKVFSCEEFNRFVIEIDHFVVLKDPIPPPDIFVDSPDLQTAHATSILRVDSMIGWDLLQTLQCMYFKLLETTEEHSEKPIHIPKETKQTEKHKPKQTKQSPPQEEFDMKKYREISDPALDPNCIAMLKHDFGYTTESSHPTFSPMLVHKCSRFEWDEEDPLQYLIDHMLTCSECQHQTMTAGVRFNFDTLDFYKSKIIHINKSMPSDLKKALIAYENEEEYPISSTIQITIYDLSKNVTNYIYRDSLLFVYNVN